jgi:hypothetical protein
MGSQIIKLNDKDSEVDEIILFSTPILYGFICGVGSFNHDLGIAGIALFAFIGSLISIFKNLSLFLGMLALGIASMIFPILGIVAVCVMVFLFFRRLTFLLQHINLIILGLGCYGLAFVLIYVAPLAMTLQDWRIPVAIGLLGTVAFYFALLMAKKMGYSAKVALEIMSLLPLLLIAFILPFLKLHIGIDHVGSDVSLPDHAMNVMPTAEAHAVGAGAIHPTHFESYPTPDHHPVVINGEKPLSVAGNINSPDIDAVQQHSFGSTNLTNGNFMNVQNGGQEIIQNTTGQTAATIQHFGNQDLIKDPLGQTVASVHQFGNQEIIQNTTGQTVATIQHFGNQDLIKDPLGQTVASAHQLGNQEIIQNSSGQTVASIQHFGNQDLIKDPLGQTVASVHQLGNQEIIQNTTGQAVFPVQHFGNHDLIKDPLSMPQGMVNHVGGQGSISTPDPYSISTDITSPVNHSTLPNQISTTGETQNIFLEKADSNITMPLANNLASSSNSAGLIGVSELSSVATESAGIATINGLGKVCNHCRVTNRRQAKYCNGCGILLPG